LQLLGETDVDIAVPGASVDQGLLRMQVRDGSSELPGVSDVDLKEEPVSDKSTGVPRKPQFR